MHSKINNYLQKTIYNNISKNYRYFVKTQLDLCINYFFWLNNELFVYKNVGFCIKKKKKNNFHMDNFILYYFLRNMRINQMFFTNTPFIFLIKKKNSDKKNKKIFLL